VADTDITKIGMAAIAAGSIGGFGGHTLGTGGEETIVNTSSIQSCQPFIDHAKNHADHQCDIKILQIKLKD
jgi:hypothetical protein